MHAARSSRRRIPPEYVRTTRSAAAERLKRSSSSFARARACRRGEALEPAEQDEVLAAGELLVERRVLARERDHLADVLRVVLDVVAEHRRAAAVGLQEGGEDPDRRRLAGAVVTEQADRLAGVDRQVEPVERQGGPEPLAQFVGGDCCVHLHPFVHCTASYTVP